MNPNVEFLSKSSKRQLKANKWQHADEVTSFYRKMGISVERFAASSETPHLRIQGRFDYWPATMRFYDLKTHKKGVGFEALKDLIAGNVTQTSTAPRYVYRNNKWIEVARELDSQMKQAMDRDSE